MKSFPIFPGRLVQTNKVTSPAPFRNGQVFFGKVHYIDPNGNALIQLGSEKLVAKIEAPLDVFQSYWFQVEKGSDSSQIKLKVLQIQSEEALLRQYGLPATSDLKNFIQQLKKEHRPLEEHLLIKAAKWFASTTDFQLTQRTIQMMLIKNLPLTDEVFQGMLSLLKGESLTSLFQKLHQELQALPNSDYSNLTVSLEKLTSLLNSNNILQQLDWTNGGEVLKAIQILSSLYGYYQFRSLNKGQSIPTIYQQLQKLLAANINLPEKLQIAARAVLNRIQLSELLSTETDNFIDWNIPLSLPIPGGAIDASFQWKGKKQNGQLDTNYFQIFLDLQMPYIGKTDVFINVQNRLISIFVSADNPFIEKIGKPLIGNLKDKLENQQYQLSFVKFEVKNDRKVSRHEGQNPPYSSRSLDVKI